MPPSQSNSNSISNSALKEPVNKKTIEDINVSGKRVLVRVDFNLPQDASGSITDDRRIRAALPTIRYLMDHCARTILVSHLGRPKGDPSDAVKLTLMPIAERLGEMLGHPVKLAPDCIGARVKALTEALTDETFCCWRTCVSIRRRRRTIRSSRDSWLHWPTSS